MAMNCDDFDNNENRNKKNELFLNIHKEIITFE